MTEPLGKDVGEVSKMLNGDHVKMLVDCTSGDPLMTVKIGEDLKERGITMIDCPVSGGPRGAAAGTLTAMFGGTLVGS